MKVVEVSRRSEKIHDRKTRCVFCDEDVTNFSRHLFRKHEKEPEVQDILKLEKSCKERHIRIGLLRKKGDFTVMMTTRPVKRPRSSQNTNTSAWKPCPFCKGNYSKANLYKHCGRCPLNPKFNNEETKFTDIGRNRWCAQANSLLACQVNAALHEEDENTLRLIYNSMSGDEISLLAQEDFLIRRFATRLLKKTKYMHQTTVIKSRIRELARLLMELRKMSDIQWMLDVLKPQHFDAVVLAVKKLTGYNATERSFESPSVASHFGTNLKQLCDMTESLLSRKDAGLKIQNPDETKEDILGFRTLVVNSWSFDVSSMALQDLKEKKWKNQKKLPTPDDFTKFKDYVDETLRDTLSRLRTEKKDRKTFKMLLEATYVKVILLNRRRPGELQRLELNAYQNAKSCSDSECHLVLNDNEKALMNAMKRVTIRGKRNRPVPILFSPDLQQYINVILKLRASFINPDNIYLFAHSNLQCINGVNVLQRFAKECGAAEPQTLTSTNLRKHAASVTQLVDLSTGDRRQFSDFMGHTEKTHNEYYR